MFILYFLLFICFAGIISKIYLFIKYVQNLEATLSKLYLENKMLKIKLEKNK